MMIRFTDMRGGICISAAAVVAAHKHPQELNKSLLYTAMVGPQGQVVFIVNETPEEVMGMVNEALADEISGRVPGSKPLVQPS